MKPDYNDNPEFYLATEFALNTFESLFVSGRAGTGKTTFLKYIREHSNKRMAVAAPTGIAAMNAGGVTLHSLLQIPVGTYAGDTDISGMGFQAYNRSIMMKNLRINDEKKRLLRELDILVIDEVSMLRCDTLDAADAVLKHVRKDHRPFGGLQMLFVGDLQQLPPVVNQHEWQVLRQRYATPFFNSAQSYSALKPVCISFQKIYRQSDRHFIDLLEKVRTSSLSEADYVELNKRYIPGALPDHNVIVLTTHNRKADLINQEQLNNLKGEMFNYDARETGDFLEKTPPAERKLQLKTGAQIMFLRNDQGPEKRYYNGKLGVVSGLGAEEVEITFEDGSVIDIEPEEWRNIRYRHNLEQDTIEEEVTGSFRQYPIRLAWAITIHKSQGLTFDKVMVDAAEAFEAGQVYVALSRCRSLEGIVLSTPVGSRAIPRSDTVQTASEISNDELLVLVNQSRRKYLQHQLVSAFNFGKFGGYLRSFLDHTEEKKFSGKETVVATIKEMITHNKSLEEVAARFSAQLLHAFQQDTPDLAWIQSRMGSAIKYFSDQLTTQFLQPFTRLRDDLAKVKGVKAFKQTVEMYRNVTINKYNELQLLRYPGCDFSDVQSVFTPEKTTEKKKLKKGETFYETKKLYDMGKTISEIAQLRGLTSITIENHLAHYISLGELKTEDFVAPRKIAEIEKVLARIESRSLSAVKEALGHDYSYSDIRFVMAGDQGEAITGD